MKKTRKMKFLSLCIAFIMLATLFTGCTPTPVDSASPAGEAPAPESEAAAPASDAAAPVDNANLPAKDKIKVGFVAPFTGPMAAFTVGIRFTAEKALALMNKDGGYFIKEYNKKMPIEIIWGDSESSPTKASEVANKLVTSDKVDFLIGEWTPETINPVSVVGERNKIPTLLSNGPDVAWLQNGPYEWSYAILFSFDTYTDEMLNGWDKLETNKQVGLVLDSSVDGVLLAGIFGEKCPKRGYTVVDPGRFPTGTKDFTATVTQLQKEGCDILYANSVTPDLVTLWNQCQQLGYTPKIAVMSKGMHFAADVKNLPNGENISTESFWSPTFPFKSSLTGQTSKEQSDEFSEAVNQSPDLTVGYDWAIFDILHDVFTRAQSVDKTTVRDAIAACDMDYTYGHLKFEENHVGYVPIVFIQWVPDEKWGFKKLIVDAAGYPSIPAEDKMLPLPNAK